MPDSTAYVHSMQVQGITWDDGCYLCQESACKANTYIAPGELLKGERYGSGKACFTPKSECEANPAQCDLVVYVVWTGTDREGRFLHSANRRFSQFQAHSAQSYMDYFNERVTSLANGE